MYRLLDKYKGLSEPVKASIWYMFANILNKGLALLATPIFTRILTEEEYGTYAVYQSWSSILIIFTSLNIFLGGYQKGLILYKTDKERFTSSQLGLTSVITLIWFIIYLFNIEFWNTVFQLSPLLMLFMFIDLLILPGLDFWSARQRFEYKYKKYVCVSLLMSICSLAGGIIAVILIPQRVEGRIGADILVKIFIAGFLFIMILYKGKCIYNREYWIYALKFNIPLIPHYLSNYVLNQSDRLMISKMIGNSEAAYYSVAYTISTMMLIITSAINNSLTPYLYRKLEYKDCKTLKNVTRPIVLMVAVLSIVTIIFGPEIIYIFAGKNYSSALYVIPPISCSVFFIFLYNLFSNIEYFYEKTGYIALATCLSAILNILLNLVFIKKFGYYAAGYTTLVCYIVLAIIHYIFYLKICEHNKLQVYDIKYIVSITILMLILMIILTITYKNRFIRYLLALVIIVISFICRKKILSLFKELKK